MFHISIQGACSCSWKPCIDASNWLHSGSATSRPSSDPINASHRAVPALRSEPVAITTTAATIGTQITRLSRGTPRSIVVAVFSGAREPQGEQHEHPDDHHE